MIYTNHVSRIQTNTSMKAPIKNKTVNSKPTTPVSAAKVDVKAEQTEKVTAHPKLVEAIIGYDGAKKEARSYLIEMATIKQQEQLSKQEVLASLMKARGIDRKTAGEQYSRIRKILESPETLQELRDGVIDLATAKAKTSKKQENPSTKKAAENGEKVIIRSCTAICTKMKELGIGFQEFLTTFKQIAKKNGIVVK